MGTLSLSRGSCTGTVEQLIDLRMPLVCFVYLCLVSFDLLFSSADFNTGKTTVSTTASELTLILEQFNIQVNNPCAILMQETSKQFLATAKPQDKYQVYFPSHLLRISLYAGALTLIYYLSSLSSILSQLSSLPSLVSVDVPFAKNK